MSTISSRFWFLVWTLRFWFLWTQMEEQQETVQMGASVANTPFPLIARVMIRAWTQPGWF